MSDPTLPSAGGRRAEMAGQDGRTDRTDNHAHRAAVPIATLEGYIAELTRMVRSGRVPIGHRSIRAGGVIVWRFESVATATTQKSRLEMTVEWMQQTRKLSRREFLAECPAAGNSNKLHGDAIKWLAEAGEIVKDHGYWIWKE